MLPLPTLRMSTCFVARTSQYPKGTDPTKAARVTKSAVVIVEIRRVWRNGARRRGALEVVMQGRREPAYWSSTWATEDAAARPSSVIPAAQSLFRQTLLGPRAVSLDLQPLTTVQSRLSKNASM